MPRLSILVASTRPGRVGLPIAQWVHERAQLHGKFEVDFIDLKEVNLPFLDEAKHPRLQQYEHEHTKRWSERVRTSDAFAIVTPEYNHGPPPVLLNAIDFLMHEWAYKPAAFVSYGGISGGTRAVAIAKVMLVGLKTVPLPEGVILPFVAQFLENGVFKGSPAHEIAATTMFDELLRWTEALRVLR